MQKTPLRLIRDTNLQFIFLFSNADGFYVSARYDLIHGLVVPGCSNAHQSIELYIKAILKLIHKHKPGHDLIDMLKKFIDCDPYFKELLEDGPKALLLKELSDAYIVFRYGEAGAESNSLELIRMIDDIVHHLRSIYLSKINAPARTIYVPIEAQQAFLKNNASFSKKELTSNPLAQFMPI